MNNIVSLNAKRKELGLSVEELAQRANLPKSTVEKVLFGIVKNPRIDTLEAIERALELSENPTALAANENYIKKYSYLFTDEYFQRYTRVYSLLNQEQRIYLVGVVYGAVEQFGISFRDIG